MSDSRPSWKAMSDEQCADFIRTQMVARKSFGEMAAMFCDTTRNAILGKRHRLVAKGFAFPQANPVGRAVVASPVVKVRREPSPRPVRAPQPRPERRAPPVKAAPVTAVEIEDDTPEEPTILKADAFLPIPGIVPIPITDLPNRMRCRWPVETDQERHFACGAETVSENHVYCAPHRRLAVRSAQHQGAI